MADLTRVAALTLNSGEDRIVSSSYDSATGYAYFLTQPVSGPAILVKVDVTTTPPTRIGALTLNSGETSSVSMALAIDTTNKKGYISIFTTSPTVSLLVKVSLGTGTNPPTRDNALSITGFFAARGLMIDVGNQKGYIGGANGSTVATAAKCSLDGTTTNAPTLDGTLVLTGDGTAAAASLVDTTNQKGYFWTVTSPRRVVKCSLDGTTTNAPTRDSAVDLTGATGVAASIIDTTNQKGYFATTANPSVIFKCSMNGGSTSAPTVDGTLTLNTSEQVSSSGTANAKGFIDVSLQHGFFGTSQTPAQIVEIGLDGTTTNAPTRIEALALNSGEDNCASLIGNTTQHNIWASTRVSPGIVVQVFYAFAPFPVGSIASAEAIGTVTFNSLSVFPNGVASAEAFGTALINIPVTAGSIASAEAFGTPASSVDVSPASIASAEAFGTATISSISVDVVGIASAEAIGVALLSNVTVFPGSIASSEAIGTVTAIVGPVTVSPLPFWYVFNAVAPYPFWYPLYKFPYGND